MTKQKVLIVDDNTTNISFVADTLKDMEYISIVFATSGFKALEILDTQSIDLILMDINMPQMDGFETVKKMQTDIPVIYVTALDDKQNVLKAFENGGVDYITKPFYPQELLARVSTHLRLARLNKDLQSQVEIELEKNRQKEQILMQQVKLASMGEMIDAIAHQWQQPINLITLRIDILSQMFKSGKLNKDEMNTFKEKISLNIDHMISTINEFRTFARPNKLEENFNIKTMCEKVLLLVKDEFINQKIIVNLNAINDFQIRGVENEFKHLILNLINNAKDAFNEKNTPSKQRIIDINILSNENKNTIEVIDKAGGIPQELIKDIFKSNISTKENSKGTGIGLYLSSQIAQKYNGTLRVKNIDGGAKFVFEQKK